MNWKLPLSIFAVLDACAGIAAEKCPDPFKESSGHLKDVTDSSRWRVAEKSTRIFGIQLTKSKIADVDRALRTKGNWKTPKEEDPHEALEACFRGKNSSSPTIFISKSALGDEIISVQIAKPSSSVHKSCAVSNALDKTLQTDGGIRLGLTKSEVIKKLGAPGCESKARLQYSFEQISDYKEAPTQSEDLKAYDSITFDFRLNMDKVEEITLYRFLEISH